MVTPKMLRRGHWPGLTDAARQAFVDLESNVSGVIAAITAWTKPRWNVVRIDDGRTYSAQPWDMVVTTTVSKILFPESSAGNSGSEIAVCRETPDNATVIALAGTVNNSPSVSVSMYRTTIFFSTGNGWFSDA